MKHYSILFLKSLDLKILNLNEVDSTNNYALRNLSSLSDRQVIVAEKQTRGHGRLARKWVSHVPENVYMSLVLKPFREVKEHSPLTNLTQYMSVVICEFLLKYNVHAELKWPNDVLVKGAKIAGLLGESTFQGILLKGYVLGAGINLNMTPDDLKVIDQPATSLNLLTGNPVNRDSFISGLLDKFFSGYDQFLEKGFLHIKEQYTKKSTFLGKKITVTSLLKSRTIGIAKNFTDYGSLILAADSGKEKIIKAGDITCL